MPIQSADDGSGISNPASLTKFVRDVVQREPPRPVAAQSFGTVTAANAVHTPSLVVGGVVQPKITTRSLSLGPPPNPADGDIWVARDVDGNGTRWMFQYNAESASAYKWEYIGGAPAFAGVEASESTSSGTYTDLTTVGPQITLARGGDYIVHLSAAISNTTANDGAVMSFAIGATEAIDDNAFYQVGTTNSTDTGTLHLNGGGKFTRITSVPASTLIKARYRIATAGTATFIYRRMTITPIRIS